MSYIWNAPQFFVKKVVSDMWMTFFVIVLVAIDQVVKYFVSSNLKFSGSITVIPGLLDFIYVENRGAAFGMFQNQQWFFVVFALIMILFFVYLIKFKKLNNRVFLVSAVLIISGGIGNLIDRIFLGYVVDYMKLSFFSPVCNFADYCITFGTVILIVYIIFFNKDEKIRS